MTKFSMSDLLNSQSKSENERPAFEIRHIPIEKIKPSKDNIYGMRGIEELAANIEMLGLLHNLDVKEADEAGFYEIISGERRFQACKLLYESGNKEFATIPCKVESITENKAISELKLLYANAAARELTDYEKTYQAGRIKEILQTLKKDGYKFKGRMRDIVADMLDVSPAQMGRMESINKNLSPEFKEEFKAGNIGITTAYELSGQSEAEQAATLEAYKEGGAAEIAKAVKKPKEPKQKPQTAAQPQQEEPQTQRATAEQKKPPQRVVFKSSFEAVQELNKVADNLERHAPYSRSELVSLFRAAAQFLKEKNPPKLPIDGYKLTSEETGFIAVQCLKCGKVSVYTSNNIDGRRCKYCAGGTKPIGFVAEDKDENQVEWGEISPEAEKMYKNLQGAGEETER